MRFKTVRLAGAVGTAAVLAVVALLTLSPIPRQAGPSALTPWWCLVCGDLGMVDVILNLLLFIPLGVTLHWLGLRPRRAALTAFLVSLAIELLQATIVVGRDSSVSDLATNTLGGWAGACLGLSLPLLWRPDRGMAGRLTIAGGAAWLGLLAFTAWVIQPLPPRGSFTLRGAPPLHFHDQFEGILHGIELNGTPHAPGPLDTDATRSDLRSGQLSLGALGISGEATEYLAPFVDIVTDEIVPAARLGQLGNKVSFTVRSRADRLRLRGPYVKIYRALPLEPGFPIEVAGGIGGSRLWAEAREGGRVHGAELPLTPGLGWSLFLPLTFYPFDYRPSATTAAWIALPLLLVGFWGGRWSAQGMPALRLVAGAVPLLAVGMLLIPAVFGVLRDGGIAWSAAALALAVGWAAGRYAPAVIAPLEASARRAPSP